MLSILEVFKDLKFGCSACSQIIFPECLHAGLHTYVLNPVYTIYYIVLYKNCHVYLNSTTRFINFIVLRTEANTLSSYYTKSSMHKCASNQNITIENIPINIANKNTKLKKSLYASKFCSSNE